MTDYTFDLISPGDELCEKRCERFRAENPGTCVSLRLNLPGREQHSPQGEKLFAHAFSRACAAFGATASFRARNGSGPYAFLSVPHAPREAEIIAEALKREKPYFRLLCLNVLDIPPGKAASPVRGQERPRPHVREEDARVESLFTAFYADMARDVSPAAAHYASLALEAALYEAASSPSPGLVDPFHTGSHKDMDFFTFLGSSAALASGFAHCAEAGFRHEGEPPRLLPVLRHIGIEAEKAMLRATGGVNTQKGLLFSMGLALGAVGLLVRDGKEVTPEGVGDLLRQMAAGIVARELGDATPRTAGEKAYRHFGISGIRGEVEAGLPSVLNVGLPVLESALAAGEDCNKALIRALVALIAEVEDTTLLARCFSIETLHMVREKARVLQASGLLDQNNWKQALWELDAEFVEKNLSPGGSADLLALTWFLHRARVPAPLSGSGS